MSDEKIINSIKGLAIDMIDKAKSGHPGISLGAATIIYTLYSRNLIIALDDFKWNNRDRFVMSAGHGSALLYSMLFYCGYLSLDNLKKYRQISSITPGHPEMNLTPGVDMTTGPLGQGIASSVGMAISSKYLSSLYGKDFYDFYTYVLCGDGDLMEGISYEAMSLAGTLKLNNLIVLYDSNGISLDGRTGLTFNENVKLRVESMGWQYLIVDNGNSVDEIDRAIKLAKTVNDKPIFIEIKTTIGKDSLKENTNLVHGSPLSEMDIEQLKKKLGLSKKPFDVDNKLVDYFQNIVKYRTDWKYKRWNKDFNIIPCNERKISINRDFEVVEDESMRDTNSKVMNLVSKNLDLLIGGTADLSSSTKTILLEKGIFDAKDYSGRNIFYGVREHSMAAISNGMASCGLMPFASTFLAFSDYMKPSIRLSALMGLPVTYVFTHDSITIGSDGPTHQPVEHLTMLRSIPNLRVFRPADVNEIVGVWNEIVNNPKPSAIIVSRNSSGLVDNSNSEMVKNGAYIVYKETKRLDGIIIATGTEVSLAIKIAKDLEKNKLYLRVVSMTCMSLFEESKEEYKESVLPAGFKKFVIEYGSSYSWNKYVYADKYLFNVNDFGKSGSKDDVISSFDLDIESIKKQIKNILNS